MSSSSYKPGADGFGDQQRLHYNSKATFSGMTAMIGVLALIADIISVAVPHWGYYSPGGPGFYQTGESCLLYVVPI